MFCFENEVSKQKSNLQFTESFGNVYEKRITLP